MTMIVLNDGLPNYRRPPHTTADYHRLPQTNIVSPQTNFYLPQTNSNMWESYLEDGKLPQTTFYLPQTNSTWWESYLEDCKLPQTNF